MGSGNSHPGWKRMRFKRNKVWVAADEHERPLIEQGKVLIKYQLDQPHQYRVNADSIKPLDDDPGHGHPSTANEPPQPGRSSPRPRPRQKQLPADTQEVPSQDTICIYTDGACSGNPGPAGIGIILLYQGHRKEISRYIGMATNNIAELEAIKVGLTSVKNRQLPVVLFTDSSYCLGLLTQGWKAKQNQALVQQVRSLASQFKNLRIVKVKGHAGHAENECADRLAVKAVQTGEES
jgi:ribonuclease HI